MLIIQHAVQTTATPATLWKYHEDARTWSKWYDKVQEAQLNGPLKKGVTGFIKLKSGRTLNFVIQYGNEPHEYKDITDFPLWTKLHSHYTFKRVGDITTMTNRTSISGLFAPIIYLFIKNTLKEAVPEMMNNLVKLAENESP